jgi:hypothetical protein
VRGKVSDEGERGLRKKGVGERFGVRNEMQGMRDER